MGGGQGWGVGGSRYWRGGYENLVREIPPETPSLGQRLVRPQQYSARLSTVYPEGPPSPGTSPQNPQLAA